MITFTLDGLILIFNKNRPGLKSTYFTPNDDSFKNGIG